MLETDACDRQIVAVIYQEEAQGGFQPIDYFSKIFTPAQWNNNATKREFLEFLMVVTILRPCL